MRTRGFTLTEVLITVGIIAILASMALPQYRRVVERQRWQEARDMLVTIYAGEQTFASINNNDYLAIPGGGWDQLYMDNPTPADGALAYKVTATKTPPQFTATATWKATDEIQTIDQTRKFGGDWAYP
jgi:type IV pilus assembly protein PilE